MCMHLVYISLGSVCLMLGRMKPRVEYALLHMLLMCVSHLRSSDKVSRVVWHLFQDIVVQLV